MTDNRPDVYVITGGGGGMGTASARLLGKRGIVLLTDIDVPRMEQTAAELRLEGMHVETHVGDIVDGKSLRLLAEKTRSLGRLAGIAHTAGISPTMSDWKRIFEVDLIGTAALLEVFLPLAEPDTAVVCVASMASYMVPDEGTLVAILSDPKDPEFLTKIEPFLNAEDPTGTAYALAKRGVVLLCEILAPAWGQRGARIVSLSPGIIDTPMGRLEIESQPQMKDMILQTPLSRTGRPEEIAMPVDFLMSKGASFITGVDLRVDGGFIAAMLRASAH